MKGCRCARPAHRVLLHVRPDLVSGVHGSGSGTESLFGVFDEYHSRSRGDRDRMGRGQQRLTGERESKNPDTRLRYALASLIHIPVFCHDVRVVTTASCSFAPRGRGGIHPTALGYSDSFENVTNIEHLWILQNVQLLLVASNFRGQSPHTKQVPLTLATVLTSDVQPPAFKFADFEDLHTLAFSFISGSRLEHSGFHGQSKSLQRQAYSTMPRPVRYIVRRWKGWAIEGPMTRNVVFLYVPIQCFPPDY